MNALCVGYVDVFVLVCDIVATYKPLDSFFFFNFILLLETSQKLLGSLDFEKY